MIGLLTESTGTQDNSVLAKKVKDSVPVLRDYDADVQRCGDFRPNEIRTNPAFFTVFPHVFAGESFRTIDPIFMGFDTG